MRETTDNSATAAPLSETPSAANESRDQLIVRVVNFLNKCARNREYDVGTRLRLATDAEELATVFRAMRAPLSETPKTRREDCRDCDGCGWYEGGSALKTHCDTCGGTGFAPVAPLSEPTSEGT